MRSETTTGTAGLSWLRAAIYAAGYLAVCAVISVLPLFAQSNLTSYFAGGVPAIHTPEAGSTAELIVLLLMGAIFLGGLLLAWWVHRSWRLSVVFILLVYPAFMLPFVIFLILSLGGLPKA